MQSQKSNAEQITQKVWAIVNALPHREAILESDARAWVGYVVAAYGELAIWHATRAGGFGGSQIGALVRNHCGYRADHEQSAHDIVAGALLRKTPDEPNGHMRRGIAMEDQHRPWFYEKYAAIRDVAGFMALSKGVGPRAWMRYSPDDLVFMGGRRGLIDFKAPSQVDDSAKVAFQYVCQLHMGRLVCLNNETPVDFMLLSQFDWANWALKDDLVAHIPQLDQLIEAAGDHYWDFVLRGELPPYVRKPKLDAEGMRGEVGEVAGRLARIKAIIGALKKQEEMLDEQVRPALQKAKFGEARLALDGISYAATTSFDEDKVRALVPEELLAQVPLSGKSTKRYDEDAMRRKLRSLGVTTSQFLKPSALSADALYEALADAGYDADSLVQEQLRGTLDKRLSEEAQAIVAREYADLIFPAEAVPDVAVEAVPNGREGHQTRRYVPRSVSA